MLPTGKGLFKPLFGARKVLVISICRVSSRKTAYCLRQTVNGNGTYAAAAACGHMCTSDPPPP
jgi:hypothetical protein